MKIGVIGLGYVGLANALLLARENSVIGYDISNDRIASLTAGVSPIDDAEIQEYLTKDDKWTTNFDNLLDCELLIIATPTDYDESTNQFDTSSIDSAIDLIVKKFGDNLPLILIKSTVPIGYTASLRDKYHTDKIIFSPEFLRESKALYDNLHPSRIVIGCKSRNGQKIASLLADAAIDKNIPILLTDSTEAEAIKLFSNTYLAMRVAFFNELDTFAHNKGLDAENIIRGVSLDPRIGDHYNNPSFGYGGYCLPKDTKQLLSNYKGIPNDIINAIIQANNTRKQYIADEIIKLNPKTVGIYRLNMKSGSDNFRAAAIHDVIDQLNSSGIIIKIYEPSISSKKFNDYEVVADFEDFANSCDLIVANRMTNELEPYIDKIFTRDIFKEN